LSTVFLETSALLRVLFNEPGGDETRAALKKAERIFASRLLRIETERSVLRVMLDDVDLERHAPAFDKELRDLWSRTDFFEMTPMVCELAGRIAPRARLRSLDAIHLATFRQVQTLAADVAMLTFDKRIIELI
jgi:predicted nucleic acid-binding protein